MQTTELAGFELNGRAIRRKDGTLKLADGTSAGADINIISSIRFAHPTLGLPLERVLAIVSSAACAEPSNRNACPAPPIATRNWVSGTFVVNGPCGSILISRPSFSSC